jgi:hypothetical protein
MHAHCKSTTTLQRKHAEPHNPTLMLPVPSSTLDLTLSKNYPRQKMRIAVSRKQFVMLGVLG